MKKSLMKLVEQLHIDHQEEKLNDHVMVMLEVDDNGIPVGTIIKVKGTPYQTLGMVDMAIQKLEAVRENIYEKFDRAESASKFAGMLPDELRSKLEDFEKRAREAAASGDMEALEKLRDEMKSEIGLNPNEDDDGFNMDDFKNGF